MTKNIKSPRKRPNIRAFYISAGPMMKLRSLAAKTGQSQSSLIVMMIEREHAYQFSNEAAKAALL